MLWIGGQGSGQLARLCSSIFGTIVVLSESTRTLPSFSDKFTLQQAGRRRPQRSSERR